MYIQVYIESYLPKSWHIHISSSPHSNKKAAPLTQMATVPAKVATKVGLVIAAHRCAKTVKVRVAKTVRDPHIRNVCLIPTYLHNYPFTFFKN